MMANVCTKVQKCSVCKKPKQLTSEFFKEKQNGFTKSCLICLEKKKNYELKYKCVHGKRKDRCFNCGHGAGLCKHGKRKNRCRECGTSICIHNKLKDECKICSSAVKVTIIRIIKNSRMEDKKEVITIKPTLLTMSTFTTLFKS